MTRQQDGNEFYRSTVLRESNTFTYYANSEEYASFVNGLLKQSGHEDTWQSITITRPAGLEVPSAIRVIIDSLVT